MPITERRIAEFKWFLENINAYKVVYFFKSKMASPYDLHYADRVAAERKRMRRRIMLPDRINPYDLGHVALVRAYLAERKMSPNNPRFSL